MKISIKNMKLSIKNMKFSVYKVCQNSSFVLFITEFFYHMYRKNAVLNGKQKQMKPLYELDRLWLSMISMTYEYINRTKIRVTTKILTNRIYMIYLNGSHSIMRAACIHRLARGWLYSCHYSRVAWPYFWSRVIHSQQTWFLKNQVWTNLIFTVYVACKNQVRID